jgi:hypothetical protein
MYDPLELARYEREQAGLFFALKHVFRTLDKVSDPKLKTKLSDFGLQIDDTVDAIASERAHYNETVHDFNRLIRQPVAQSIADYGKYSPRPYADAANAAQAVSTP